MNTYFALGKGVVKMHSAMSFILNRKSIRTYTSEKVSKEFYYAVIDCS